ncbi:MAG TPA: M48 family metallopeptidase [Steroidobacteraceae bacterium]
MSLTWLAIAFVIALVAETAVRLWLGSRQIGAVQAHRDRVPEQFSSQIALADHQKAADYTVARVRFGRIGAVLDAALALALTFGGGIAAIDAFWRSLNWQQPWLGSAVILSVFLVIEVIRLPFAIWRTFRLEARFGFNRTTPALFVSDLIKRLLLALLIGVPLLAVVLSLFERAGQWWWIAVWLVWVITTFALTWAWPRFIAPLFNRFTPLTDEALRARVEALLERCGFTSSGLFIMDGSRRSAHGNAYFTGFGRNKRIVFFDTLIERLAPPEVEAVLAHELGHFRLRHIRQRLIVTSVGALVGLAILAWLAARPDFYTAFGVPQPSAHAALLLFLIIVPVFMFLATPLGSWWSRRHELEADDFAAKHADASALAAALVKLYRDNASTLTPDRLHSAFYDSHPPALVRISRLQLKHG